MRGRIVAIQRQGNFGTRSLFQLLEQTRCAVKRKSCAILLSRAQSADIFSVWDTQWESVLSSARSLASFAIQPTLPLMSRFVRF